ncbi:MAG: hypothetical protein N3A71_04050 [Candidatus Dojkabacteria bacterium]|nr:hypothetical protein [Candidatus Dojkabacteria bacterium]
MSDFINRVKSLNWKLIGIVTLVLVIFVFLILAFFWVRNTIEKVQNADRYKSAYDALQKEREFCRKIEGTNQKKEVFYYCDLLDERFKDIK